jgi:Flp pilus assembly protein TadB
MQTAKNPWWIVLWVLLVAVASGLLFKFVVFLLATVVQVVFIVVWVAAVVYALWWLDQKRRRSE